MGTFTEEITLKNARDAGDFRHGRIKAQEIRQVTIQAIPDTGASRL
jgi:hypothetical protein